MWRKHLSCVFTEENLPWINPQSTPTCIPGKENRRTAPCSRYLLVSIVADVQRVAVLVHLLRPTTRRRAILTVRLARVGTEAGVLRWQRLEPTDGEREEGKERRRERERSGLPLQSEKRERKREGREEKASFTTESERRTCTQNH